mmetsp:Transcript_7063/g.12804  ORF Transcript_7063/g.12804 Transcript_7063/m.12804 type:complete len:213 (-) Transcript_7063:65-703(-)
MHTPRVAMSCHFPSIGGDILIPPLQRKQQSPTPKMPLTQAWSNTDRNLWVKELGKLMIMAVDVTTNTPKVAGEQATKDLIETGTILIPMVIDRLCRVGPIMHHFPCSIGCPIPGNILNTCLQANAMVKYTLSPDCPSGIITHVCTDWKCNRTRQFYERSHTTPTPREHTIQQLSMSITKAYGNHLRKPPKPPGGKTALCAVSPTTHHSIPPH